MILLSPKFLTIIASILFLLTACMADRSSTQVLEFDTQVYINEIPLTVAILKTPEEQSLGLMGQKQLPDNSGALFVLESERATSMWMKNTLISLDIFFFDDDGRMKKLVESAQPCKTAKCKVFSADGIRYVLEVNSDFYKKNKLLKPIKLRF